MNLRVRWERGLVFGLALSVVSCASQAPYRRFDPSTVTDDSGAIMGRVSVYNGSTNITSSCSIAFNDYNRPWIRLDQSGLVFTKSAVGEVTLNRVVCQNEGSFEYEPKGASFNNLGAGTVTYFGDVTLFLGFERNSESGSPFIASAIGGGALAGALAGAHNRSTNGSGNDSFDMKVEDNGAGTAGIFRKIASEQAKPKMLIKRVLMSTGH